MHFNTVLCITKMCIFLARTVTGLKIGSQELGRLHAEWNPHPKQEYCSLKYRVMCTDGDKTKFSLDIIGTDADLDEELCNGKITVMAVRDYTEKEPDDKSPNKELHL